MARVLVRGSGDVGSAVALRLREAGHKAVIADGARPPHPRRGMAFTDAYFEGVASLEGVLAKRARGTEGLGKMLACAHALPVSDAGFPELLEALSPEVVVDARMRKYEAPESLGGLAPLTIGLGPGFVAGADCDLAIETAWGDGLGGIIRQGAAREPSGTPRLLGGHGRERYVHSPVAGILRTGLAIGDAVAAGQEVARVGETPIHAPLAGILRGLTHDGADVAAGAKIVEVDARGDPAAAFGVGERPRRIAAGVLAAVEDALRQH